MMSYPLNERQITWSTGWDLNSRFYGFAIRCLGPLGHLCIMYHIWFINPHNESYMTTKFGTPDGIRTRTVSTSWVDASSIFVAPQGHNKSGTPGQFRNVDPSLIKTVLFLWATEAIGGRYRIRTYGPLDTIFGLANRRNQPLCQSTIYHIEVLWTELHRTVTLSSL